MNKRIVAISVLFLMLLVMTASVFADEEKDTEYEYTVEVSYYGKTRGGQIDHNTILKKTYTLWASSVEDAREQAQALCEYEFGDVASCGAARVTGRTRPAS